MVVVIYHADPKVETGKLNVKKNDMLRSIGKQSGESMESVLSQVARHCKRPGKCKGAKNFETESHF